MSGNRRDRSRSPTRVGNVGRRREKINETRMGSGGLGGGGTMASGIMSGGISGNGNGGSVSDIHNNMMNPQMMMTNMYPGNMMMAGGMYPNMMMPNTMMGGGIMPSTGIDMMPSSGMEMIPQPSMDISSMSGQPMQPSGNPSMDLGIMGGMMMDPSMMGNMAMYPNSGGDMPIVQEKKEIILKHCKLTPPNPGMALPPRRSKPPGCRTIFVGGLPDNIRENIVREIFENYGRIHILRLSTKNFCHIRFDREGCVDAAMQISGYNIKLISKESESEEETKANSGWLHVDYALSRDDQNEYERRQRQAMRAQEQQLHQMGAQQQALVSRNMYSGRHRSPSPMRLQPFSNAAIVQLAEKIKSEENFSESLPTLISWLERGECSKKNSNQFYSMIQATNSHIRRLYNEKVQAEDELSECKERIKNTIALVIEQLEQVAKVFAAATHQRVWDHFTKPQRKNIETWQKMSQEFNALKEEFVERFSEENEYNGYNPSRGNEFGNNEEVHKLKLENDSLKFQLEAYKNEVDVIKADAHKELEKFKAQYIARQALQGNFDKNPPLPSPLKKPPPPPPLPDDMDNKINLKETVEVGCGEAKLIGIMSAFLQVHPQGASLDYVVSYVRAMFPNVSQANVHHVLQKHDDVFKRTTSGVGANIEHRWSFIAFQNTEI